MQQIKIPTNRTVEVPNGFSVVVFGSNGHPSAMTLPRKDRNDAARRGALLFSDVHHVQNQG